MIVFFCVFRARKDLATMTHVQTYTPKISPSLLNNEAEQYPCSQEFTPIDNFQSSFAALPPSFTSFLSNCGPVVEQGSFYYYYEFFFFWGIIGPGRLVALKVIRKTFSDCI